MDIKDTSVLGAGHEAKIQTQKIQSAHCSQSAQAKEDCIGGDIKNKITF